MPRQSARLTAGLVVLLLLAGSRWGAAQSAVAPPHSKPPVQQRSTALIPESTTMAVLATSLVGLFLAGLQKRRKS